MLWIFATLVLKLQGLGPRKLFVETIAPHRMIAYTYGNQYQLFILPKHALGSLFYYINLLIRDFRVAILSRDWYGYWMLDVGGRGESVCEMPLSHYCTAEIKDICMILYI